MRLPARGWAGLAAGLFACAASAAQAQPMTLADADLDQATAGFGEDLFASDWLTFGDLPDFDWSGGGADFRSTTVTHSETGDGNVLTSTLVVSHTYSVDN